MPIESPVTVIPAGFAKVTHDLTRVGEQNPYTVSYAIALPAVDVAGLTAAADACATEFNDAWQPVLSNEYVIGPTLVTGSPDDGDLAVESLAGIGAGADADPPPPSNSAVLIEKRTAQRGRQHQGRMFFPGIVDEDAVGSGGGISTVVVAALQVVAGDWASGLVAHADVGEIVILHTDFIRNPAVAHDDVDNVAYRIANPIADTPTVVTAVVVDPVLATQRRRMR